MEIDLYGLVAVVGAIIFAVIIGIPFKLTTDRKEKAARADYEKKHEIKGIVNKAILMPYIPSGELFDLFGDREEQTLVVFENKSRIRIKGLHPEIERGESWIIKYRGTNEWFFVKPLIEKKKF